MHDKKHVCPLCDYLYDERIGDKELGISPGTKFEDLPDGFRHPNCEATIEMLEICSCATVNSSKST